MNNIDNILPICDSICKINIRDNTFGSGFFMKLKKGIKDFYCLFSCEHVLTKRILNSKMEIKVLYNNGNKEIFIKLDKKERFIRDYKYLNIDASVVEILPKDNVEEKYFLEPNLDYLNGYDIFNNKKIYILQYPGGLDLKLSSGIIILVDKIKYEFVHIANTENGSSGSPIILEETNKVIGIHKQGNIHKELNYANFIGPIVTSLKNNKNYIYKKIFKDISFEGEISDDEFEADGKLIKNNEVYYIGHLLNYVPNGIGVLYENKNIIYEGEFNFGIIEGHGKKIYDDNSYYIGKFEDSKRNGEGILYNKDNIIIFEGTFENDKYKNGRLNYDDRSYYVGEFEDNKRNGKGILYKKDNTIKYDGSFLNDNFSGEGKLYYEDNSYYIGNFINGLPNGKGVIYGYSKYNENNGKIVEEGKVIENNDNNSKIYIIYEGDLINGELSGKGILQYEDGKYYDGEFENNKKNGKGELYDHNNKLIYCGDFKDDNFDGNGQFNFENGEYYLGEFKGGYFYGNGIIFKKDGTIKFKRKLHDSIFEKYYKLIKSKMQNYLK